jgi:hypothetical protein
MSDICWLCRKERPDFEIVWARRLEDDSRRYPQLGAWFGEFPKCRNMTECGIRQGLGIQEPSVPERELDGSLGIARTQLLSVILAFGRTRASRIHLLELLRGFAEKPVRTAWARLDSV